MTRSGGWCAKGIDLRASVKHVCRGPSIHRKHMGFSRSLSLQKKRYRAILRIPRWLNRVFLAMCYSLFLAPAPKQHFTPSRVRSFPHGTLVCIYYDSSSDCTLSSFLSYPSFVCFVMNEKRDFWSHLRWPVVSDLFRLSGTRTHFLGLDMVLGKTLWVCPKSRCLFVFALLILELTIKHRYQFGLRKLALFDVGNIPVTSWSADCCLDCGSTWCINPCPFAWLPDYSLDRSGANLHIKVLRHPRWSPRPVIVLTIRLL
jgi:hypothetical protein